MLTGRALGGLACAGCWNHPCGWKWRRKGFFLFAVVFPSGQKTGFSLVIGLPSLRSGSASGFALLVAPARAAIFVFSLKNKRFTTFAVQMTTVEYSCRLSEKCLKNRSNVWKTSENFPVKFRLNYALISLRQNFFKKFYPDFCFLKDFQLALCGKQVYIKN